MKLYTFGFRKTPSRTIGRACAGAAVAILAALAGATPSFADQPYNLDEAVRQGVVDINFNPWAKRGVGPLTQKLAVVNPGLVNRIGFHYGGQSDEVLNAVGSAVAAIHKVVPRAIFGGGFNEAVYKSYNGHLACGGNLGTQTFAADQLASKTSLGSNGEFVDISKPRVQDYYVCIGQISIDKDMVYLHFEAPSLVIRAASGGPESAYAAYKSVESRLREYAASKGKAVYFSGDMELAAHVPLEGMYLPSRFYHVTIPKFIPYQNRIPNPGVGVGYTYALSDRIIADTRKETPPRTRILFYVDNWDPKQDDLRRVMELDGVNRRKLYLLSAQNAIKGGAYFIPPLVLCQGCIAPKDVGDPCELLDSATSEYDALACDDLDGIRRALDAEAGHRL